MKKIPEIILSMIAVLTMFTAQASNERVVLMPLRVSEADKAMQRVMETALVEGLQQNYVVISGDQVAKKAREIFFKESRDTSKKECDEAACMQTIAKSFQAELIAIGSVTKRSDGYFIAINIHNIIDNKMEYSRSLPCKNCTAFEVIGKLKKLGVANLPTADSNGSTETTDWRMAQTSNTHESFQAYIAKYPNGIFVQLAQAYISKLANVGNDVVVSQLKPGEIIPDCAECPDMVVIPAGSFLMGGNNRDMEKPLHVVQLQSFKMGRSEVTQAQWLTVMEANPSAISACRDCPVEQVSWDDVQNFIHQLNRKTGKNYRLPTEAEWEYACRAGAQHTYCGSDKLSDLLWYDDKEFGYRTYPDSQRYIARLPRPANAFGLYGMSGNVREWVQDCLNLHYKGAPTDGSAWEQGDCDNRIVRNGPSLSPTEWLTASFRQWELTSRSHHETGFRLAHD